MARRLNTSPFALYNFKMNNTGMIPVLFRYGETVDISITLQLAPTLGGVMSVVYPLVYGRGLLNVEASHKAFSIITKINYVYFEGDSKYTKPLYAYKTELTEEQRNSGNVFGINNEYHIDSSQLPGDSKKRERGYFTFEAEWGEKTGNFKGTIASFALPISERIGK
ncbi:hypothetical protein [Limosilactobacillus reuteri]|uniref:hypothetical protein n=1 Tax=Limosilactobacillus reuteri TaxID=1598 RepID=UPI00235E6586|nr:hypothetical protein [Limosilactobacillus reuteri]MDD1380066.1 hypothetical protein [Limosilactobacillus reuteri]